MKDELKQVVVLLLNYKGAEDTLDAIKSLETEREYIEAVFVCDNASPDSSLLVLRAQEAVLDFKLLANPENSGFAGGFNFLFKEALRRSHAPYFLALNNDTEATKGFLKELLSEAHPDRILSPKIVWMGDRETVIQSAGSFDTRAMKVQNKFAGLHKDQVPAGLHEVELTDGCCFLLHRHWLEKNIFMDENLFMYFEDIDFFLRLRKQGARFFYQANALLFHKEYGSTGGRSCPSPLRNYYFWRNRFVLCKKIHPFFPRWRRYWSLFQLAREVAKRDKNLSPQAVLAIFVGIKDFFLGKLGKKNF